MKNVTFLLACSSKNNNYYYDNYTISLSKLEL